MSCIDLGICAPYLDLLNVRYSLWSIFVQIFCLALFYVVPITDHFLFQFFNTIKLYMALEYVAEKNSPQALHSA